MQDDKTTYKIEAKYDYEDGILEVNIPAIIAELSTEDKEALAKLHLFDSAMWEELKRCLRDEYTSKNYNSTIHKLRIELLSGDDADPILKRTVRGILGDLKRAERGEKYHRDNYWQLRQWCLDTITSDQRCNMPKEIKREKPPDIKNEEIEKAIAEAQKE